MIWIVHAICKNWNIVLYQHILYEISLFSISMKTHFKQITRIELKLTNLDTTLRVTTYSWWRHVLWCRSFTNRTRYYSINFSVSVHPFHNAFFIETWILKLLEILKLCPGNATSRHYCITTMGARVAQWGRSLDLEAHRSIPPIQGGFATNFVNYNNGALDSQPQVKTFTSWLPRVSGSLRVLRIPPPL